ARASASGRDKWPSNFAIPARSSKKARQSSADQLSPTGRNNLMISGLACRSTGSQRSIADAAPFAEMFPEGESASSTPSSVGSFDDLGRVHISTSTNVSVIGLTVFATDLGKGGEGIKGGDLTATTRHAVRPSASAC